MQTRWLRSALLISVPIFVGLGCSVTHEESIVGTYLAEAPCVTITLVVNRDHSFVQSAKANSGVTNRLSGKWRIDKSEKSFETVDFEPFLDFHTDGHGLAGGLTGFHAERWPRGVLMGPVIVQCSDSSYKIDYVK